MSKGRFSGNFSREYLVGLGASGSQVRRIMRRGGGVRGFLPRSFRCPVIYAVSVVDHPGVVKVGRTVNWSQRGKAYFNWNLREGDGVSDLCLFEVNDEWVDLEATEAACLGAMPGVPYRGREWFECSFLEAVDCVREVLCRLDICFTEISDGY